MNADALLKRAGRYFPEALCWCDASTGLNFSEAAALVAGLAGGLAKHVRPGDRVALVAADSVRLLALVAACWRSAALPCLVDPRLPKKEAEQLLERIRPKLVLSGPELESRELEAEPLAPGLHGDESPLFCSTTSGTTGPPKLAVLRSGPVTLATACIAERAGFRQHDCLIATTPTSSSFQLVSAMLPALHVGAAVVLAAGRGAAGVKEVVAEGMGSVLCAYPLTLGDVAADPPPEGLRLALSGGSPLAPRLKCEYRERLGIPLVESYGMSELGGFVAMGRPGEEGAPLEGAVGRPLPDRPVAVLDPEGREVDSGVPGEVVVCEGWMAGYLDDPEATARATIGGVLHTGDLGVFDSERNLTVLARLGEAGLAAELGGYPRLCEDVLHVHPKVLHATAVKRDGRLAAYVQPRPGQLVQTGELLAHATQRLPPRLVPSSVTVVAAMPRTFSGKLDRRAIRRL